MHLRSIYPLFFCSLPMLTSSQELLCPEKWNLVRGSCVRIGEKEVPWTEAAVACRDMHPTSRLGWWRPRASDGVEVRSVVWLDAVNVGHATHPADLLNGAEGCATYGSASSAPCTAQLRPLCMLGGNGCNRVALSTRLINSQHLPEGSTLQGSSAWIVSDDGSPVAHGAWRDGVSFAVPAAPWCGNETWTVEFHSPSEAAERCGDLRRSFFRIDSNRCAHSGTRIVKPDPPSVPSTPQPGDEDAPTLPNPSSAPPIWMWIASLAALLCLVAAAAAGVSAKMRRRAAAVAPKGEGEEEEEMAAPCDLCSRFDPAAAQARLTEVREALHAELSQPLDFRAVRCQHLKGEHVHVFDLSNELHAYSLGALSTTYSRMKPRLPRNTRIHILHKAPPKNTNGETQSEFAEEHAYIADQYF